MRKTHTTEDVRGCPIRNPSMPSSGLLVADLSPCRPGLHSRSLTAGYVVISVAVDQVSFPITSAFHCDFHSTSGPYCCSVIDCLRYFIVAFDGTAKQNVSFFCLSVCSSVRNVSV